MSSAHEDKEDCNFTLYWSSLYDTDYRYKRQFMSPGSNKWNISLHQDHMQ